MTTRILLLEEHEWLGEFWLPGSEGEKFPGIVRYSARDGLILTTSETGRSPGDWGEESKTIQGVTHATGPLTLLRAWPRNSGTYKAWALEREIHAVAAISQGHFDEKSRFRKFVFEANNLDEFFHPQGHALRDGFTRTPVLSGDEQSPEKPARLAGDSAFRVSVAKDASGLLAPADPAMTFVLDEHEDAALIHDLNKAVSEAMAQHGQTTLVAKKGIVYQFIVEAVGEHGATFEEFRKVMFEICGLLSLLFLKIVRPRTLKIEPLSTAPDADPISLRPALVSLLLTDAQFKSVSSDKGRFSLPVTSDALTERYGSIMRSWFRFIGTDLNIIYPTLINHICRQPNELQEYVLLMASVDQCSVLETDTHGKHHQWFIRSYSSDYVVEQFLAFLPSGTTRETIGKCLVDIRNCIAHPRKVQELAFRKYRDTLNDITIRNLSELIFISLTTYVYEKIGLSADAIESFTKDIDRHIRTSVSV